MKKIFLTMIIYTLGIVFITTSCKKEKTREELLKGDYSLKFASIDGEEVTGLLINDSVNLFRLYTAEVEDDHPFIFYFRPFNEKQYEFFSSFDFIDDIKLSIHNISWNGNSIVILDKNPAFLAFTKQDQLILNIETLTENQLIFNTVYLDKTYRYEFKE
jgi:hypothetical protein